MICSEQPEDYQTIFNIHKQAFGQDNEAELVNALRKTTNFNPELSLLAFINNEPIGHLLLYPVSLETNKGNLIELGLGPVAVKLNHQNKGLGTKLIKEGIKKARQLGYTAIVVVGNPKYYKRFGFIKASIKGLKVELDVPEEDFMILELIPDALKNINGLVKYSQEFNSV